MRRSLNLYTAFRMLFAGVWLVNGIYCKLTDGVPRHRDIVARILGEEHATAFTLAIGVMEVLLAAWILSGRQAMRCDVFQIVLILGMNLIEWLLAPDLLLFGRFNLLFAFLFCVVIYLNMRSRFSSQNTTAGVHA